MRVSEPENAGQTLSMDVVLDLIHLLHRAKRKEREQSQRASASTESPAKAPRRKEKSPRVNKWNIRFMEPSYAVNPQSADPGAHEDTVSPNFVHLDPQNFYQALGQLGTYGYTIDNIESPSLTDGKVEQQDRSEL